MPKDKVNMVCSTCGSDDVLCDAYGEWSVEGQRWELVTSFDKGAHCNACDGECRIIEQPIPAGVVP